MINTFQATIERPATVFADSNSEVEAAARWLDANYPGWADTVDLDEFHMGGSDTCIGHYLRVDWWEDLAIPWTTHRDGKAPVYEFGIGMANGVSTVFSSFTNAWRREIEARTN